MEKRSEFVRPPLSPPPVGGEDHGEDGIELISLARILSSDDVENIRFGFILKYRPSLSERE